MSQARDYLTPLPFILLSRNEKDMTPVPPVGYELSVPILVKVERVLIAPWVYQTAEEDFIPECEGGCSCGICEVAESCSA